MPDRDYNRLLFIGGITASEKTSVIDRLLPHYKRKKRLAADANDIQSFTISEFLLNELGLDNTLANRDRLPDYMWRTCETRAVERLIQEINTQVRSRISIINCHYAVSSPGGFITGLTVDSLVRLAEQILADAPPIDEAPSTPLAAVVLVESKLELVLERRREGPRETSGSLSTREVVADLEFNRIYSLLYYQILANIFGYKRTSHLIVAHNGKDSEYPAREIYEHLSGGNFF